MYGRNKNCFRLARHQLTKSWERDPKHSKIATLQRAQTIDARMRAAAREHDVNMFMFMEGMHHYKIGLTRDICQK